GIRGGSVLFHVIKESGTELEEIVWGFGPDLRYAVMLCVRNGSEGAPTLVKLQDKYKQRVQPVPSPQILVQSLSITEGWCNVTLECSAVQVTEDLNVTFESKGLPRQLGQTGTPGPASNSWTLHVSLPLSQPNASLTCVGMRERHLEEKEPLTSIYSELQKPGQAMKMI
ncbi:hypothetical protein HPG69_006405, partial [Diceros bicornis minor]